MYVCMYLYVCMYVCMYECMCVCMYLYVCVYVSVCMYVCMQCVCVCVCTLCAPLQPLPCFIFLVFSKCIYLNPCADKDQAAVVVEAATWLSRSDSPQSLIGLGHGP